MQVVVGANLTLAVDVTGFNQPLTAVTWRRGATELTNHTTGVTITNSDLSIAPALSVLTVSPIMSPSADEAVYTVTAESPAGMSNVVFDVGVFGNAVFICIEWLYCSTCLSPPQLLPPSLIPKVI